MTVLPGPFSSPPAANSSGLARSSCRASSRAKANFTGRSTSAESLSEAPASAASRRQPSGVTMATAPLSSRYVAAHSSNRRQRLGIFALATLPVSASINAQTLSPDKPRVRTSARSRVSPSIDLTGYRQSSPTVPILVIADLLPWLGTPARRSARRILPRLKDDLAVGSAPRRIRKMRTAMPVAAALRASG